MPWNMLNIEIGDLSASDMRWQGEEKPFSLKFWGNTPSERIRCFGILHWHKEPPRPLMTSTTPSFVRSTTVIEHIQILYCLYSQQSLPMNTREIHYFNIQAALIRHGPPQLSRPERGDWAQSATVHSWEQAVIAKFCHSHWKAICSDIYEYKLLLTNQMEGKNSCASSNLSDRKLKHQRN